MIGRGLQGLAGSARTRFWRPSVNTVLSSTANTLSVTAAAPGSSVASSSTSTTPNRTVLKSSDSQHKPTLSELSMKLSACLEKENLKSHNSANALSTSIEGVIIASKSKDKKKSKKKSMTKLVAAPSPESSREMTSTLTSLRAHCDACRTAGLLVPNSDGAVFLNHAVDMLKHYRLLWLRKFPNSKASPFHNEALYNDYFSLSADHGDWCSFVAVWNILSEEGFRLSAISLAHAFRCLTRWPHEGDRQEARDRLITEMDDLGLTPQALFASAKHLRGKKKTDLALGLKHIFKDFDCVPPSGESPQLPPYKTELLKSLNAKDTSRLSSPVSAPAYFDAFPELLQRQLRTEYEQVIAIPSILAKSKSSSSPDSELAKQLVEHWRTVLRKSLSSRIERKGPKRTAHVTRHSALYPFLKALDLDSLVNVVLETVVQLLSDSESYSPSVSFLQSDLGTAVMKAYHLMQMTSTEPNYINAFLTSYVRYTEWFRNPTNSKCWCPREAFVTAERANLNEENVPADLTLAEWPFPVRLAIGRELLNSFLQDIQLHLDKKGNVAPVESSSAKGSRSFSTCPAFFKIFRTRKNSHQIEEIKAHPKLVHLFSLDRHKEVHFRAQDLPMVVPPMPWISSQKGGYLLQTSTLIRVLGDDNPAQKQNPEKLISVLDALNNLGSTPWIINQRVLDVILEVFANKQIYSDQLSSLSIPRHPEELRPPTPPAHIARLLDEQGKKQVKATKEEMHHMHKFMMEKQLFAQLKSECFSLWCDVVYRLSIAHHFRNDVLYFPHNMDFRGRVYPLPPHLNHMGNDLARSMLIFAEGRPLGPRGLQWLKLHTVNLTGVKKKCSIQERLQYAEELLDDILDSAANPLGGRRWWMKSEDPWQTLSACFEVAAAINSGDPDNFVSRLPIHQDGSCNGLQHYAALGRDVLGAGSVNLIPAERPQDVYSEIAAIVERKRKEDAAQDGPCAGVAQLLEGFIQRKVIKQTVMTTVYGVTRYGAKLQIAKQLKDLDAFPAEMVDGASKYLANKTFDSLNEMFASSQQIQAWLTECAVALCTDLQVSVTWETPLGLYVQQPYTKLKGVSEVNWSSELEAIESEDVLLAMQRDRRSALTVPNVIKQKNGFPPNFVHSLDSTHMMLTAMHLWNAGCTFASVHDCYWTHACSVEEMNRVCREQFVKMHSSPILESLSQGFLHVLDHHLQFAASSANSAKAKMLIEAIPPKGSLDLNVVRDSTFFFS